MKLSLYIEKLQNILNDNGDLDCYYAKDAEGNGYQEVGYEPSIMLKIKTEDKYEVNLFGDDDTAYIEELIQEEQIGSKDDLQEVVCVN